MSRIAKAIVLVVHASEIVAAGIRSILSSVADFEVMPRISDLRSWPLAERASSADIIVTDYWTAVRLMDGRKTGASVLIVETSNGELYVRQALRAGARGFVLHDCRPSELIEAVRTIKRGRTALSASVGARLAESLAYDELTPRETAVLRILMRGLSNQAIASELGMSVGTVKVHMKAILSKLRAGSRTEAVAVAQRRGMSHFSEDSPALGRTPRTPMVIEALTLADVECKPHSTQPAAVSSAVACVPL